MKFKVGQIVKTTRKVNILGHGDIADITVPMGEIFIVKENCFINRCWICEYKNKKLYHIVKDFLTLAGCPNSGIIIKEDYV